MDPSLISFSTTPMTEEELIPLGPPNWCQGENRWLGLFYWNWLQPIGIGLMAISIIPFLYQYILAYKAGQFKQHTKVFWVGLVFFTSILLTEFLYIPCIVFYCWDPFLNNIFGILVTQGYSFQTVMLLGIWCHRLYSIFQATAFKINKCVIVFFSIFYLITAGLFSVSGVLFQLYVHSFGPTMWAFGFILVILFTTFLVIMFIFKLFQAYQGTKDVSSDQRVIRLITKTSLLAFISTACVIFSAVTSLLIPIFNSPHTIMVFTWALSIDMYTNFICIFLSYQYSEGLYVKLCGSCDRRCFNMWRRCAGNTDLKMMEHSVHTKSSTTATSAVSKTSGVELSTQRTRAPSKTEPSAVSATAPDMTRMETIASTERGGPGDLAKMRSITAEDDDIEIVTEEPTDECHKE